MSDNNTTPETTTPETTTPGGRPTPGQVAEGVMLEGVAAPVRLIARAIERNPFVTILAVLIVGFAVAQLGGCASLAPTVASPVTGEPVNHDQLQRELSAEVRTREQAADDLMAQADRAIAGARRLDADTDAIVTDFTDANETLNERRAARGAAVESLGQLAAATPYGQALWPLAVGLLGLETGRKELKIRRQRRGAAAP